MTWSYNGNPSHSARFAVRFLMGDTDSTRPLIQDEEIDYILAEQSITMLAAANACDSVAAKFGTTVSKSVGGLSISGGEKSTNYAERANRLRALYRTTPQAPFVGGQTRSSKDVYDEDIDLVHGWFDSGMHDIGGEG